MRWLVVVGEWLVLLPLWRWIFRPRLLQGLFAAAVGLFWLIVVIGIIAAAVGDGKEESRPEDLAQASVTPVSARAAPASPTPGAVTPRTDKPEPPGPQRIVAAAPGAVAEAEDARVTLLEVADPWTDYWQPRPGTRYVAIKVAVENVGGRDHHLRASSFALKTSSYDGEVNVFREAEPALFAAGRSLTLSKGSRAEGWVTFTVAEGSQLKMLKYDPDIFTTNDIEFHFE